MASDEIKEEPATVANNSFIINMVELFALVLRRWWLFLIVGVVAGVAGIYYASLQQPIYKSRLTFALDDGGSSGNSGIASLASQFGLNVGGSKEIFAGDNILEIMKSRRIIENVLLSTDTFNNKPYSLAEFYLEKSGSFKKKDPSKNIHFPAGIQQSQLNYQQDSVLKILYGQFSAENIMATKPDRKLNIFEVNVTSPNELFTKVFTDRLVASTNSFYTEIRTKKAKETLQILENRVASMKGNLSASISGRASVQDANLNPAFEAAQVPALKQQANIQAYGGAFSEMFKNLEMARFQYLNEIPLMQVIDDADFPMEKIKMGKLKTGVIASFAAAFLLFFIFWMHRVIKFSLAEFKNIRK